MLINRTTNTTLAKNIEEAKKYRHRIKGLLGRRSIEDNYAFIIHSCSGVHTYFMRFTIDVLLLDKNKKIIYIYRNMPPWKTTRTIEDASYAIEMKGNSVSSEVQLGHMLEW